MAKVAATELEVAGHTVRVSNPDKIYFPDRGFTKLDVVQYYLHVGDGILRALRPKQWLKNVLVSAAPRYSGREAVYPDGPHGRRLLSEAPAH